VDKDPDQGTKGSDPMAVSAAIIDRIHDLVTNGMLLSSVTKGISALTFSEEQSAEGWLTSAHHVVQLVIRDHMNPYRRKLQHIVIQSEIGVGRRARVERQHIDAGIGVLRALLQDIDAGLIVALADRVRAEVFDDFLDHADEYHKHGRKEAGVIAGVVFEDTLRRIAEKAQITERKVEDIIAVLVKKDIFTETKAKRARAAAHVKTKATRLTLRMSPTASGSPER
jgi:hypothetical protein